MSNAFHSHREKSSAFNLSYNKNGLRVKLRRDAFIMRNCIKDAFRITQSYKDLFSEQLEDQEWFQFTRLHVNAWSHNQRFEFRDIDKEILPACFNGRFITLDHSGKRPSLQPEVIYELMHKIIDFIKHQISIDSEQIKHHP
jgi:hypothetical protein